ncbi:trihelix transcription factor ASIL1 [Syzygium oleosum]|uniref:trihelix transcription factor ASIL1 n=1 Tax=Syzygium oleosum TaxID=219896 RepID=UPI0024B98E69|nr:trihelix transcription factor ASIL1 [Syzygium oleosum]
MASHSSSSPSPSPPNAKPIPSSASGGGGGGKKPQPVPWTHEETVNLIRAYGEKWYALKRGPLKSSQWEEVAVTVAARCGYSYAEPSKTATQCRHKMEKLRKRYRAEKQQRAGAGGASGWPYYELMVRLERGPMPISARPIAVVPYGARRAVDGGGGDEEEEEEEEEEAEAEAAAAADDGDNDGDEDYDGNYSKSRSINHILRRPAVVKRFPRAPAAGGAKRKRGAAAAEQMEEELGEEEEEGGRRKRRRRAVWEIAGEIRGFAERYVGMENVKMEMVRESERWRMELERKRMDLIAESQGKILDAIAKAFAFHS